MKINLNIEFDTNNPNDLDKIEEVMYNLQEVKDLLEDLSQKSNTKQTATRGKNNAGS